SSKTAAVSLPKLKSWICSRRSAKSRSVAGGDALTSFGASDLSPPPATEINRDNGRISDPLGNPARRYGIVACNVTVDVSARQLGPTADTAWSILRAAAALAASLHKTGRAL